MWKVVLYCSYLLEKDKGRDSVGQKINVASGNKLSTINKWKLYQSNVVYFNEYLSLCICGFQTICSKYFYVLYLQ